MSGIERVAVIGAGTMGHGIAQAAASAGWEVWLTDERAEALPAAQASIAKQPGRGGEPRQDWSGRWREAIQRRIHPTSSIVEAARGSDLVIEAVVEDLAVKQAVLQAGREPLPGPAPSWPATRRRSRSPRSASALPCPGRFLGLHFFNPVHLMKLVEIVVHQRTTEEARGRGARRS